MMNTNTDKDILIINLGKNILAFRKKHNLTQEDIALDIDMDVRQFRRIENAECECKRSTFIRIFDYCAQIDKDITPEKLLGTV